MKGWSPAFFIDDLRKRDERNLDIRSFVVDGARLAVFFGDLLNVFEQPVDIGVAGSFARAFAPRVEFGAHFV